jgi:hypothetical protein
MAGLGSSCEYRVQRTPRGTAGVEVELVRSSAHHEGLLLKHRHADDGEVLFRRTFRPIGEADQIEAYASQLEQISAHASAGTFGCFVDTTTQGGEVRITLYERWFDGGRLHCEPLAERSFDPEDEAALVQSAEFRAQLETWAEERNDELEALYLAAVDDDSVRVQRATERQAAAEELAGILADAS